MLVNEINHVETRRCCSLVNQSGSLLPWLMHRPYPLASGAERCCELRVAEAVLYAHSAHRATPTEVGYGGSVQKQHLLSQDGGLHNKAA